MWFLENLSFDDLEDANNATWRKPFFAIDYTNESELFSWLKAELTHLKAANWRRNDKIKNHYLRYKGIQYMHQVYQPRDTGEVQKRYQPQMVVPVIRDIIDEKVARLLEHKPSISVLPVHDEERDKVDAKIAKRFLSHIDYTENLDQKWYRFTKNAKIAGESFLWIKWDPDKGPLHPKYQEGMVLEDGKVLKDGVHIGEVDIRPISPMYVYYEEAPSRLWADVNYCFLLEYEYVEGLKKDYPSKASMIGPSSGPTRLYDFEKMEDVDLVGRACKVSFYHKKTKYLPSGYEACFVEQGVLSHGVLKYKHGKLPIIRQVGEENEEELHGESSIEPIRGLASQVTNQINMAIKQFMLCAYPKWFVDGASVDHQQLGNDVGIVTVKAGGKTPVLAQANPVSSQMLDFTRTLEEKLYNFGKSNSVVRGEPPSGVTAFVALQYVSESENRRLSTEVSNLNHAIRETYDMILNICGQYYKKDDQRTLWVIGKNSQWLTSKYDPESLAKPYNVMLANQSALPESRSSRTQLVLDMANAYPDLFPREQVIEMLGFAQAEKFVDIGSAAARAAEDENEHMLDGNGMIEPMSHEDLITHWKIHTMAIQDIGFKTKTSPEIREVYLTHILATEMLMSERASKNPAFSQLLTTIPLWPMLFELPPPVPQGPPPINPAAEEQAMLEADVIAQEEMMADEAMLEPNF